MVNPHNQKENPKTVFVFDMKDLREKVVYSYCAVLTGYSRVQLFVTLWTVARQVPLSIRFSRHGVSCHGGSSPPRDQTHIS